jgi:mono/diheme cytochrome c family protein
MSAWAGAPPAFEKCVKCHGPLGDGGTKAAPDLAATGLTFEQFKLQIKKGSMWKGRHMKNPRYRWKKMPRQVNLSDADIESLYHYIRSKRAGR